MGVTTITCARQPMPHKELQAPNICRQDALSQDVAAALKICLRQFLHDSCVGTGKAWLERYFRETSGMFVEPCIKLMKHDLSNPPQ